MVDRCVINAGGLVGRHVGDGVVAFFLAESLGSESAAAVACIEAARAVRSAVHEVASRSDLAADDVIVRFGLHWGSTLYVGNITSAGRMPASKALIERMHAVDTESLGIDLNTVVYTSLADLPTATDKARRDAPAVAVCEI